MTQLATVSQHGLAQQSSAMSITEIQQVARMVAASRLFPGIDNEQAAFTLMMLCQSEGLHPMAAVKRYHIIKGRPSMRADAIQAEFQRQGGSLLILEKSERRAAAVFYHPSYPGKDGFELSVSIEDLSGPGGVAVANDMYKKWPRQMLWARLVSEGVRTILPGVIVGIYSDAEVEDMVREDDSRHMIEVSATQASFDEVVTPAPRKTDERPFGQFVNDAIEHCNRTLRTEAHAAGVELTETELARGENLLRRLHAWTANQGLQTKHEVKSQTSHEGRAAILADLYGVHGKPMRKEIIRLVEVDLTNGRKRINDLRGKGEACELEDMTLEEVMS